MEHPCAFLEVPDEPPLKNSHWGKATFDGVRNVRLMVRLSFLHEEGLTGQIIVADFVTRRIAPLQAHATPMWMYSGPQDKMRLHREDNDKDAVDNVLSALFINPVVPAMDELPITLRPLHQYNMTKRQAILEGMPSFTPSGLAGKEVHVPVVQEALAD